MLAERIRGTISTAPYRLTASIGVVSTPLRPLADLPPLDVCRELITLATAAMDEARQSGGNQARHLLSPSLKVLDERDNQDWT